MTELIGAAVGFDLKNVKVSLEKQFNRAMDR
jgi:hypothetical protein